MNSKKQTTIKLINSLMGEELVVHSVAGLIPEGGKMLYGETYDMLGVTIDSLKYYLLLEYLARLSGGEIKPTIIEADLHSAINKSVKNKDEIVREGERRVQYLRSMFDKLGLKHLKVVLMSEIFKQDVVKEKMVRVGRMIRNSQGYQEELAHTVLGNRVAQEKESGYRYAAEAIAVTSEFGVKVGPPREQYYDVVARKLLPELRYKSYGSIYLRPSYPLTPSFSFYLTNPEIEKYGLTPYKAGSNKMQEMRIVLGVTPIERVEKMVKRAYLPVNIHAGNPLIDLAMVVEMSSQLERGELKPVEIGERISELVSDRGRLSQEVKQLLECVYD